MKSLFLLLAVLEAQAFAKEFTLESQCHIQRDRQDRDRCHVKRLKLIKAELSKDKNSWKDTLNSQTKKDKQRRLGVSIRQMEAQIMMLKDELRVIKSHKADLDKAPLSKP